MTDVNVLDPEFYVDPVGELPVAARRGAGVLGSGAEALGVSRYDDVMAIEKDGDAVLVVLAARARTSTNAPTAP